MENVNFPVLHGSHKLIMIEGPQSGQREVASHAQKRHCVSINEASLQRVVRKAPSRTFDQASSALRSLCSGECPLPLHLRFQSGHRSKRNRHFHDQMLPVQFHWHCCRYPAASPSATRFSLSITAKLDFCPGNYIIFMILDIDLSLDPFPLPGEEVETKRKPPQKKSEQIRYRTSREIKNVDRNTYRSIPDREKCRPQSMALNDVGLLFTIRTQRKRINLDNC